MSDPNQIEDAQDVIVEITDDVETEPTPAAVAEITRLEPPDEDPEFYDGEDDDDDDDLCVNEMDIEESGRLAADVALDTLDEEADWGHYTPVQADHALAFAVAQMIATHCDTVYTDSGFDPAAVAEALRSVLLRVRGEVEAAVGQGVFPSALA